jgi:hypothetical protein
VPDKLDPLPEHVLKTVVNIVVVTGTGKDNNSPTHIKQDKAKGKSKKLKGAFCFCPILPFDFLLFT